MADQETTVALCFNELQRLTVFSQHLLESPIFVKSDQNSFSTSGEMQGRALYNSGSLNLTRCKLGNTEECFPNQAVRVPPHIIRAEAQRIRQKGARVAEAKSALLA